MTRVMDTSKAKPESGIGSATLGFGYAKLMTILFCFVAFSAN